MVVFFKPLDPKRTFAVSIIFFFVVVIVAHFQ
ncbi:light-harvesting protein [Bacteroidales bacterium OttesenSCG-928-B11]|nr:light-harvesting protein [Bacteroidales bacterium OttesenSCG-928-E04]MDL2308435.1 light-harvesting protein [Bacteroidales bacterium OttesenSCG-928-C03]MDL2311299.1 light-harvesting protein [Bacteroidales bacterium OttesenSCG-928-B11]MDL2326401.1 light-harvesting protein [Bacteroidales bacterium OttesenSCG-928-A14]